MIRIRIDKHCSVLIGLALLLVMPAGAHVGDRVYPIAYLTDEMVAQIQLDDGSVGEWYELIGEPTLTLLDFRSLMGSSPDPADLDFRIWLAWHDDPARFYLAFAASDDMYQNTHEYYSGNDWMKFHDSIQFSFDGDHSGGAGCCCPCKDSEGFLRLLSKLRYISPLPGLTVGQPWMTILSGMQRVGSPGPSFPPTEMVAVGLAAATRPSA